MKLVRKLTSRLIASIALCACAVPAFAQGQVNLYTTREPELVKPLLEAFTKQTGVTVNTVFVKDGLPERVRAEGARSPADVLMTVDFGNLFDLVNAGVTQELRSPTLESAIPANLRDPKGQWFALSMRARVVYASKKLGLTSFAYEDLADPRFKGKVCIRSGQHPYNTALFAAHIAHHGPEKTAAWLKGMRANLARKAAGGDREVARDILGGICDIGIANSYYVGLMRSGRGGAEQKKWGDAIDVILPAFRNGGTHVNISGASLAKSAPNKANAIKLLEYLVSPAAQEIYAQGNYEYPITAAAKINPVISSFGQLQVDPLPLGQIAAHRKAASEMVDVTGFNK